MSIDHLLTEASDILTTESSDELITEASSPPAPVFGYDSLLIEVALNQDPINTAFPVWTDITAYMQTMTTNRGRDNFWDSYSPGTASFTFNSSLFTSVGVLPNMPIRVSAVDSTASVHFLFAGFLRPQQGFVTDFSNNISSTTISAIDTLGLLAERAFDTALTVSGSKTGTALAFIASAYTPLLPAWQVFDYDPGVTLMQDLPAGGTVLDTIQNLTFSEGGAFYVLGDGTVTFDDRMAVALNSRISTSQVTFDDTGAGDSVYAVGFSVYQPPVYTSASVTRANDDSLTVTDPTTGERSQQPQTFTFSEPTGIANYGTSSYPPVTGMLAASNTEAALLAQRLVLTQNSVTRCPKTIRLYPRRQEADGTWAQLDAALHRELRDRATFKNTPAVMPSGADVWVERIQHTIDAASKEWTCDLSFSSADQFFASTTPADWLVLDDASDGLLDGTRELVW